MPESPGPSAPEVFVDPAHRPREEPTNGTEATGTTQPTGDDGLAEKQQMVEKLFRHTNKFLEENKHDPLLVVEALAAILVRYAALLGPVEQMGARLAVLERLIGQECAQIQEIVQARSAPAER